MAISARLCYREHYNIRRQNIFEGSLSNFRGDARRLPREINEQKVNSSQLTRKEN